MKITKVQKVYITPNKIEFFDDFDGERNCFIINCPGYKLMEKFPKEIPEFKKEIKDKINSIEKLYNITGTITNDRVVQLLNKLKYG